MTRRDMASPTGDRDALKQEIRNEIRSEDRRKRTRGCLGCLFTLVLAISIPTVWIASVAARSGYARPPLMDGLYHDVEPTRDVIPLQGQTADQILATLQLKSEFDPLTQRLDLPFTEVELTTLAAAAVKAAPPDMLPFPIKRVQFLVEPKYVELFVVTPRHGRDVTMRFRFLPRVTQGQIDVEVLEAVSGSYRVPNSVAKALFDMLFTSAVSNAQRQMGVIGRLSSFELSSKKMELHFFTK